MVQATWMEYTENLDLKGLEIAINEYEILCWWLLLTGIGESSWWEILLWKVYLIQWDGLGMTVYEWKSYKWYCNE